MINELDTKGKIYVYGSGFNGKIISNYLEIACNSIPKSIVVSNGYKEENEYFTINNTLIPINELSDIIGELDDKCVFINSAIAQKELINDIIKKLGIKQQIELDVILPKACDYVFNYYLKKRNIDLENEILFFNDTKIYNQSKIDSNFKDIMFGTMGDEILPQVYNDYSLTVDGSYELDEVHLEKGDVVIDAGANIGLFCCYAAHKKCKVYACDPDKNSLKILEKQKELYPENIVVVPMGLSDTIGEVKFFESDNPALSSINMPRGKCKETIIQTTTIDEFVKNEGINKVTYIKADIEGAEREMLRGATNTLKQFAPKLSICTYHYPDDKDVVLQLM